MPSVEEGQLSIPNHYFASMLYQELEKTISLSHVGRCHEFNSYRQLLNINK